jgi:pre-rRNA-processing protein TSR3
MAEEWTRAGAGQGLPILLDPYARLPVAPSDRGTAEQGGVLVVDCSWNKLAERGGFPVATGRSPGRGSHRRLPLLIAGNPQHYGRLAELNTVEAFGAALWVLGRPDEARVLLESFHGGPAFLELNAERLERYARAENSTGVEAAEVELFGGAPVTEGRSRADPSRRPGRG